MVNGHGSIGHWVIGHWSMLSGERKLRMMNCELRIISFEFSN